VPDFWLGAIPETGRDGRGSSYPHRRSIGVLYQFYRLLRGTERIRILREQIRIELDVLWRLLRVSLTGILQFCHRAHQLDRIGANCQPIRLGSAGRIHDCDSHSDFHHSSELGIEYAAATLVGQNLGAKQPQRAETSVCARASTTCCSWESSA